MVSSNKICLLLLGFLLLLRLLESQLLLLGLLVVLIET
jgi:hypothetical protein